ncbi:MAG: hypothetical protein MRY74_03540 [Neomegalonema sp.]|nr:hypothetical protein [Neomegalonema sp.]
MTRAQLWVLNIALIICVISGAWWAMNAPRVARPLPSVLGAVDLPREKPPLPPAPFAWAPRESADGIGRRPILATAAAVKRDGAAVRQKYPAASAAPPLLAAAARRDMDGAPELKSPADPFGFAKQIDPPKHSQYFGGHLLTPDQRRSDLAGASTAAAPGLAPKYAPKPTRNPRRGKTAEPTAASPVPPKPPTPPKPARPTAESIAEAATSKAPAAAGVEGMILLGIFRTRGADRALVRKPNGGAVRVEKGDEIEGWRVYAIGDEFVELRRSDQSRTLHMPK